MVNRNKRLAYSKKLRARASLGKRALVRKTNCHLYLALTDDVSRVTIKEFSTLTFKQAGARKSLANVECAAKLGDAAAEYIKANHAGEKFLFDRRRYKYHGVVKELAERLRAHGIIS